MGLDLSVFDREGEDREQKMHVSVGSYSGFHVLRQELSKDALGVDLLEMEGFFEGSGAISWETVDSPLKLFLCHSDCDGELSYEDCAKIAPELRVYIDSPDHKLSRVNQSDYWKILNEILEIMVYAVLERRPLTFT